MTDCTGSQPSRKRGAGAVVEAGDPDASELVARITSDDADAVMPPPDSGGSLSGEQIETLRRRVEQGARYRDHWAFTPRKRRTPPAFVNGGWVRNPIDAFVLARLDLAGQPQTVVFIISPGTG